MAIRYKITLVVATSMAAILSINHSYLTVTHLFGVNDKLSFSFDLIIIPISILLICGLIYYVVGIYTDRLKVVKNSFKNIQENEVVTFPIKMKDEIGDMMFELEEVSKRMLEQDREMKMFQEERLLIANTDSLTGLPNRDNFLRKLDGREDRKNGAVLVSVVLKDILKLNALRGSDISNQVILLIVKRLQSFSTYPIILGRMSTNHFSIYYESTERINWHQLEGILVETLQKLSAPVEIEGEQLFLKVQMGISLRNSNEKTSLLNLVQLADLAVMEESGSISQNIYLSHDLLQEEHAYKQKLEVALRQSIASRDFQVVYISQKYLLKPS